jgi:hypothetical protein
MRYKAILLSLVALLYAGTASAYSITAVGPVEANTSDIINVDIMVDTQGNPWYGILVYATWDLAVLSPVGGSLHLQPGAVPGYPYSTLYMYPSGDMAAAMQQTLAAGGAPAFNGSIATLVFHVMDVPSSTDTVLALDWGFFNAEVPPRDVTGETPLTGLVIHVPEPTTTMLMGLGLIGILYAGRRR